MKFAEIIQEILLAFCIAIMIPVVVYWGVQTFLSYNNSEDVRYTSSTSSDSAEQAIDKQKIEFEQQQKKNNVRQSSFLAYLVTALLAILAGSFIKINSLSMGFIGGGVINILLGIANSSSNSIANLGIFLFLFLALIVIIITRKSNIKS